jgi:hypothetical protein
LDRLLHFRDASEHVSALIPPAFGEISASRVQGCVDTPPVRPRGLAQADLVSAAVEGTSKETSYTSQPRDPSQQDCGLQSLWKVVSPYNEVQAGTTRAVLGEEGRSNRQCEEGAVVGEQRRGNATQLDRKVAASTAASNTGGGGGGGGHNTAAQTGGPNEEGSSTSAGKVSGARRQRA